jgi:hypothetical protein
MVRVKVLQFFTGGGVTNDHSTVGDNSVRRVLFLLMANMCEEQ